MDTSGYVTEMAKKVKKASFSIAKAKTEEKNLLLKKMASALRENAAKIIEENKKDLAYAKEHNLSKAMQDRLLLNEARIDAMAVS